MNTGLNYILIFGKLGFPAMGADGAAIATLISQIANFLIMFVLYRRHKDILASDGSAGGLAGFNWKQFAAMLLPILVCEFMWSLGENVYAAIYGHLGTESCAAMTLLNPINGLMIGALCGLSQAASVIVGKLLGTGEYDEAYAASKKLMLYGLVGSLILSAVTILARGCYVRIYQVEETVRQMTMQIMVSYAAVAPFKILNMILGGGILRSGGKTQYTMAVDLTGTWVFGVPLGMLAAFVLKLPIAWVYFVLSLEECIRAGISLVLFRKRKWMQMLKS